jgi:hypothetical protein
VLEHGQIGIGGIVAQAPPCLNALAQQLHRSVAIQDQQGHPGFCGHGLHPPAMAAA